MGTESPFCALCLRLLHISGTSEGTEALIEIENLCGVLCILFGDCVIAFLERRCAEVERHLKLYQKSKMPVSEVSLDSFVVIFLFARASNHIEITRIFAFSEESC